MRKLSLKPVLFTVLAALALSLSLPAPRAAEKPLTSDDVTLLLIGGASSSKVVDIIKERGVGFQMTAELANEFRRDGADESIIQALEDASAKANGQSPSAAQPAGAAPAPPPAPAAAPASGAASPPAPKSLGAATPPVIPKSPQSSQGPSQNSAAGLSPTFTVEQAPASGPALVRHDAGSPPSPSPATGKASAGPPSKAAAPAVIVTTGKLKGPDLSDPSPERVQQIIQAFAAKETLFKQARDNYTYHQINKAQEVGPDGEVTGQYQQDWDILYDDNGARIERVTYAPLDTLHQIQITEQDLDAFRHINPFVLTSDELPDYDIQYRGHVKVDEITAYVFSIRPKAIQKGRQYFQGVAWVDDHDLQIVKSEGKQVPEIRMKNGEENLFPHFTTWREQIDGKFWFPTFTLADDTLYFTGGPVHIKEIIRYTDYKQFKSSVRIKVIGTVEPGKPDQNPPPTPKNPPQP
ncbi:MAG TPA: hypothetical protein VL523_20250 [Terriglobia bacterium]|nr:hypothetical protein [Terriglobia bacterium]